MNCRSNLGIGLMAAVLAPIHHYSLAWGPAIHLRTDMAPRTELTFDIGFGLASDAASWSPGQDRAVMGHLGITHYLEDSPWLGLTGGVYTEVVGLNPGNAGGLYLGVTPGVVFKVVTDYVTLRSEICLIVGSGTFGNEWNVIGGATSSSFLLWNW